MLDLRGVFAGFCFFICYFNQVSTGWVLTSLLYALKKFQTAFSL